jgi:chromatin segregation and condensation protein Rec8/ScpA/Scc1 (kleisin family)
MSVVELRSQIQDYVEQLSNDKLLIAADFLAHLAGQESNELTNSDEIEFDPDDTSVEDVKASLRRALQEYKEGKTRPVSELWQRI